MDRNLCDFSSVSKESKLLEKTIPALLIELKRCGLKRNIEQGKLLHNQLLKAGFQTNPYVATALMSMYRKCRRMDLAREVFEKMAYPDVVAWNCLITGYMENGESDLALKLFQTMNCKKNSATFVAVFKACANIASERQTERPAWLAAGMVLHEEARKCGFVHTNVSLVNTLIDMYSKCGSMFHAQEVFNNMKLRNVVTWTCMILGYIENDNTSAAVELLQKMDCEPDTYAFVAAMKALGCAACEKGSDKKLFLENGILIHRRADEQGLVAGNMFVANTLIYMYCMCGNTRLAWEVFEKMTRKDVVTWTNLILGCVENKESFVALEFFMSMDCEPDGHVFVAALKACSSLATEDVSQRVFGLQRGMEIHKQVEKRRLVDRDIFVANSLMDMYCKCGEVKLAREIFDTLKQRDVVHWTCLILGYVENGENLKALKLFQSMDCKPNPVTFVAVLKAYASLAGGKEESEKFWLERGRRLHKQADELGLVETELSVANTLIDMYGKCASMHQARRVFESLSNRDAVTWNCLLIGYVENGESFTVLDLFKRMDCHPTSLTFVAVIRACGCLSALEDGREIHAQVCKLGLEDEHMLSNCLVDFYGKCGDMQAAEHVFDRMHSHSLVSWTALIGGYSSSRDTSLVFKLAKRMVESGLEPDGITFVCLLTACSHAGKMEEGRKVLEGMGKYGLKPRLEHLSCMVDMLGRCNRLEDALRIIRRMPFEASDVVWTALLGACRKYANVVVGKVAFDALTTANTRSFLSMKVYRKCLIAGSNSFGQG